jgi:hypothetical protein
VLDRGQEVVSAIVVAMRIPQPIGASVPEAVSGVAAEAQSIMAAGADAGAGLVSEGQTFQPEIILNRTPSKSVPFLWIKSPTSKRI